MQSHALSPSKQSCVKRPIFRGTSSSSGKRVRFNNGLLPCVGGVFRRTELRVQGMLWNPTFLGSNDSKESDDAPAGGTSAKVSTTGGNRNCRGRCAHQDATDAEEAPPLLLPLWKSGSATVSDCASSTSSLTVQSAKRFKWPPLVRRASRIKPFSPRDASVYEVINEIQSRCNFILADADAQCARSILAGVTSKLEAFKRHSVCVRVRWSGSKVHAPINFTLTQRTIDIMVDIHHLMACTKQVLNGQAWLKAMRVVRQCQGGARRRGCECIRCDAGSAAAPQCEGRSIACLVDDICTFSTSCTSILI